MKKRQGICLLAAVAGALCLAGCGGTKQEKQQMESVEKAAVSKTPKALVTKNPELTAEPEPTKLPEAAANPEPTVTAEPANAPESAMTPAPKPTKMPEPTPSPVPREEGMLKKPDHPDAVTNDKLIFIGDSRTVGIREAVNDDSIWSCKSAMGYEWMSSTGVPQIEDEIDEYTAVIILMGVNDPQQINNYVSYINQKASEWAELGARTYFVSVGPVEKDPYVTNVEIESFNEAMETNLTGVTYIDVYSHLVSNGFYTTDGIHYPESISIEIYNYILDHLEETRSGIWG